MLKKNIKKVPSFNNTCFALGRHLTLEFYQCDPDILLNKDDIQKALLKAAKDSGATIVYSSFHVSQPQGISCVVIIAESPFTIHAWPEHDYAAVDIFTCGDSIDLDIALSSLETSLGSQNVMVSSDQNRGIITKPSESVNADEIIKTPRLYPISWKSEYKQKDPWGMLTSIDLYECDPDIIRNADSIRQFVKELCEMIDMKRFGECRVVHFGEDKAVEGFSMTQLIETSLISGHFANATNAAYLDIFSCKYYDPRNVAQFALSFFKGSNYKMQLAYRR